MHTEKSIISHLKSDVIRNCNMINFMESYSVTRIKKIGDSVLIKGKSDSPWVYISSTSKNELLELTNYIDGEDKYFAVIEDWMIPYFHI